MKTLSMQVTKKYVTSSGPVAFCATGHKTRLQVSPHSDKRVERARGTHLRLAIPLVARQTAYKTRTIEPQTGGSEAAQSMHAFGRPEATHPTDRHSPVTSEIDQSISGLAEVSD